MEQEVIQQTVRMKNINAELPASFFCAESKQMVVSSSKKKLWAVLLDLLITFDDVCQKHGIKYCLEAGTLLGAVRHNGFIPWDDDIDVVMTRGEYEKLCACAPREFKGRYFFQNNETDPGSMRGHAQLRNSDTTGILKSDMYENRPVHTFNQGLFLDIFILDKIPDNDAEYKVFADELTQMKKAPEKIQSLLEAGQALLRGRIALRYLHRAVLGVVLRAYQVVSGQDLVNKAFSRFESTVVKYNQSNASRCATISYEPFAPAKKRFATECFDRTVQVKFEGHSFPAPAEYEKYLCSWYGDWREHVVGTSLHGGMIIDTDKSYREYLKGRAVTPAGPRI